MHLPSLQSLIASIPIVDRLAPVANEQHPSPEDAYNRLQEHAFCEGFAIVKANGSEKKGGWYLFARIHHGTKRDTRGLDHEGRSASRKRSTSTLAKECEWSV